MCVNELQREARQKLFSYAVAALSELKLETVCVKTSVKTCEQRQRSYMSLTHSLTHSDTHCRLRTHVHPSSSFELVFCAELRARHLTKMDELHYCAQG